MIDILLTPQPEPQLVQKLLMSFGLRGTIFNKSWTSHAGMLDEWFSSKSSTEVEFSVIWIMQSHSFPEIHAAKFSWPSIPHRSDGQFPSMSGPINTWQKVLPERNLFANHCTAAAFPLCAALWNALCPFVLMRLYSNPDSKSQVMMSIEQAPCALHNSALHPNLFDECISAPHSNKYLQCSSQEFMVTSCICNERNKCRVNILTSLYPSDPAKTPNKELSFRQMFSHQYWLCIQKRDISQCLDGHSSPP